MSMLKVEDAAKLVRPDLGVTFLSKKMLQVRYAIDVRLTAPFEGSQGGNIFVVHHPTKPELTHDKRAVAKQ